jgi:hypothetical protein
MTIITKHPKIEHRAYGSWADVARAKAQFKRRGVRTVSYRDVKGPALQVIR